MSGAIAGRENYATRVQCVYRLGRRHVRLTRLPGDTVLVAGSGSGLALVETREGWRCTCGRRRCAHRAVVARALFGDWDGLPIPDGPSVPARVVL